ncbi:hypothetical protein E3N88_24213 [Mikania micrantha]|uniref:Uncharacterized protein n=1 Tax=Mikania micrantha TaxID=192012 RepID=A0A5N6NFG9_9ASTR|nr:hypothetical protein E3N88_24213 [Mikania micrantha]
MRRVRRRDATKGCEGSTVEGDDGGGGLRGRLVEIERTVRHPFLRSTTRVRFWCSPTRVRFWCSTVDIGGERWTTVDIGGGRLGPLGQADMGIIKIPAHTGILLVSHA